MAGAKLRATLAALRAAERQVERQAAEIKKKHEAILAREQAFQRQKAQHAAKRQKLLDRLRQRAAEREDLSLRLKELQQALDQRVSTLREARLSARALSERNDALQQALDERIAALGRFQDVQERRRLAILNQLETATLELNAARETAQREKLHAVQQERERNAYQSELTALRGDFQAILAAHPALSENLDVLATGEAGELKTRYLRHDLDGGGFRRWTATDPGSPDWKGGFPGIAIIASGGSSGSHLLARLLAEYTPFVSGPEINLAVRPDLMAIETYHLALLSSLLGQPYFAPIERENGTRFPLIPTMMLTNQRSYTLDSAEAKLAVLFQTYQWSDLVELIRARLIAAGRMPADGVLIEHSPAMAAAFAPALEAYPGLRGIHLVRDPRDAVASMIERRRRAPKQTDMSHQENLEVTARQWCFLTAVALQAEGQPGYLRVSYEDLVRDTPRVMATLRTHLGYGGRRRRRGGPTILEEMKARDGWSQSPSAPVSTAAIGRWRHGLNADDLRQLSRMCFEFPQLGGSVSFEALLDRFADRGEPKRKPKRKPKRPAATKARNAAVGDAGSDGAANGGPPEESGQPAGTDKRNGTDAAAATDPAAKWEPPDAMDADGKDRPAAATPDTEARKSE